MSTIARAGKPVAGTITAHVQTDPPTYTEADVLARLQSREDAIAFLHGNSGVPERVYLNGVECPAISARLRELLKQ